MSDFVCTTWLKRGCPFSFKFLVFMTEAGLLDKINIVEMVEGDDSYDKVKAELSEKLGETASFPTVEVEPDTYLSDSDELIRYFADKYHIDTEGLQTLPFYIRGLKERFHRLLKENRAYRAEYGELS